ncbi:MAG: M18 family aminopeptidase [Myxococcales bacterium]|nr:M18 family aminopeptidase [Myxococcales bacterium]MDH5567086.1 M18 family aminopeptidase [Myxococcales bacterium]
MADPVADLLRYIDACPTPYHAVAEAVRRLGEAGFQPLPETQAWELAPGDRRTLVRGDGSLVAFQVGAVSPAQSGYRVIGAHTDSPNLRVKPLPDVDAHGYRQLAVEIYGGVLLHTWLDRDLSLAGRVTLRDAGGTRSQLIDFARPLLRVPSLAIHLDREQRSEGLKLDPQVHLVPLLGLEQTPALSELIAAELRERGAAEIAGDDVLAFDLMTYDLQPAALAGARGEFIHAARLDNLASCHAGLAALIAGAAAPLPRFTRVLALYDHEEVGSRTAQGAAGTLLAEALERIATGVPGGERQAGARALAHSMLISVDTAHAVHPNYADRHEPGHRPLLGRGPVIKRNANQRYASDARSAGLFRDLCRRAGFEPQHFVSRNDLPCGSTIGPISAARVGLATVDVGSPLLSMHSCREMAGAADVGPMIDVLRLFFAGDAAA